MEKTEGRCDQGQTHPTIETHYNGFSLTCIFHYSSAPRIKSELEHSDGHPSLISVPVASPIDGGGMDLSVTESRRPLTPGPAAGALPGRRALTDSSSAKRWLTLSSVVAESTKDERQPCRNPIQELRAARTLSRELLTVIYPSIRAVLGARLQQSTIACPTSRRYAP